VDKKPGRRRKLVWWLGGAAIGVVALAGAGPFIYIHLIEGSAAPKLALPGHKSTSAKTGSGVVVDSPGISGTWSVGSGSVAGYRVQEVLIGQAATAVGRTSSVSGHLAINAAMLTSATFSVNMATVESDQSQRNAQFDGRIMDVAKYPIATFTLTTPVSLGSIPAIGKVVDVKATGNLSMHGVTRPLTLTIQAERETSTTMDVLAHSSVLFSDWDIQNPSVGGFVTTANRGTLEVLLHLTEGSSSGTVTTTTTLGSGSSTGGPVTIPSTTVPPLSVRGN
jgi:polyisoprenoid-binding protein YceI